MCIWYMVCTIQKFLVRMVAHRSEAAVDAADDAVRRRAQLLVLGHVGARRHGDLRGGRSTHVHV